MQLLDHFDLLAPIYDRLIAVPDTSRLEDLLGLPIDGRLLDAGGGTGRISKALLEKVSEVILLDLSVGMLMQAKDKGQLTRICSLSEILPFENDIFDRIIMVDALHHVISQEDTANELWRVLKPGGRLVIEEPDLSKIVVKLVAIAEKLALMRSHFLSPENIATLFTTKSATTRIFRDDFNSWVVIEKYGQH
jgi:demethylmenaquinone methyltransferase/2-methoxy-6-polyprenyl-1,4-benzoquinol methylase